MLWRQKTFSGSQKGDIFGTYGAIFIFSFLFFKETGVCSLCYHVSFKIKKKVHNFDKSNLAPFQLEKC